MMQIERKLEKLDIIIDELMDYVVTSYDINVVDRRIRIVAQEMHHNTSEIVIEFNKVRTLYYTDDNYYKSKQISKSISEQVRFINMNDTAVLNYSTTLKNNKIGLKVTTKENKNIIICSGIIPNSKFLFIEAKTVIVNGERFELYNEKR